MNDNKLVSALVWGLVLAGGGVGLFLLLYFVVLAGAESATRLLASLLAPPFVMALLVGGYFILTQDEDA